jgi:hypothetical protein
MHENTSNYIILAASPSVTPEDAAAKAQGLQSRPHAAAKRGRCVGPRYTSLALLFPTACPSQHMHCLYQPVQ